MIAAQLQVLGVVLVVSLLGGLAMWWLSLGIDSHEPTVPAVEGDESTTEPTQRSTPDVQPGHYLPPRDCQVLIYSAGEEFWSDVEFTRQGAEYGWRFASSGVEVDPSLVVDWREVPLRGGAA